MPLKLKTRDYKAWDVKNEEFIDVEGQEFELEHSLFAISKWEAKHHNRFFGSHKKTPEETLSYIQCMIITPNIDPNVVHAMTQDQIQQIADYMTDPMTGTTFSNGSGGRHQQKSGEELSSELIYYYMSQAQIPFECDKWHINRLMTLLRVAAEKSQPTKKMPRGEQLKQQRALNRARHAKHGKIR